MSYLITRDPGIAYFKSNGSSSGNGLPGNPYGPNDAQTAWTAGFRVFNIGVGCNIGNFTFSATGTLVLVGYGWHTSLIGTITVANGVHATIVDIHGQSVGINYIDANAASSGQNGRDVTLHDCYVITNLNSNGYDVFGSSGSGDGGTVRLNGNFWIGGWVYNAGAGGGGDGGDVFINVGFSGSGYIGLESLNRGGLTNSGAGGDLEINGPCILAVGWLAYGGSGNDGDEETPGADGGPGGNIILRGLVQILSGQLQCHGGAGGADGGAGAGSFGTAGTLTLVGGPIVPTPTPDSVTLCGGAIINGVFYGGVYPGLTPVADGTVTPVTSVTTESGIVTAIS